MSAPPVYGVRAARQAARLNMSFGGPARCAAFLRGGSARPALFLMPDAPRRPHQVTQLDIYQAIDGLKQAIEGKFDRVDERLRAIESIGPSSFGPRIGHLEQWQNLADGPGDTPSLPAWRTAVDNRLQQIVGIGHLIRWGGVLVTLALGLIAVATWLRGPL